MLRVLHTTFFIISDRKNKFKTGKSELGGIMRRANAVPPHNDENFLPGVASLDFEGMPYRCETTFLITLPKKRFPTYRADNRSERVNDWGWFSLK